MSSQTLSFQVPRKKFFCHYRGAVIPGRRPNDSLSRKAHDQPFAMDIGGHLAFIGEF